MQDLAARFRAKRIQRIQIQQSVARSSKNPGAVPLALPSVMIAPAAPLPQWFSAGAGLVGVALIGVIGYALLSKGKK